MNANTIIILALVLVMVLVYYCRKMQWKTVLCAIQSNHILGEYNQAVLVTKDSAKRKMTRVLITEQKHCSVTAAEKVQIKKVHGFQWNRSGKWDYMRVLFNRVITNSLTSSWVLNRKLNKFLIKREKSKPIEIEKERWTNWIVFSRGRDTHASHSLFS